MTVCSRFQFPVHLRLSALELQTEFFLQKLRNSGLTKCGWENHKSHHIECFVLFHDKRVNLYPISFEKKFLGQASLVERDTSFWTTSRARTLAGNLSLCQMASLCSHQKQIVPTSIYKPLFWDVCIKGTHMNKVWRLARGFSACRKTRNQVESDGLIDRSCRVDDKSNLKSLAVDFKSSHKNQLSDDTRYSSTSALSLRSMRVTLIPRVDKLRPWSSERTAAWISKFPISLSFAPNNSATIDPPLYQRVNSSVS